MVIIPRNLMIYKDKSRLHSKRIIINSNFVIVRTPKCGSSTLYDSFNHLNNKEKLATSNVYQHEGINALSHFFPKEKYPNVKYIGISRNPYAKLISWYFHHLWQKNKQPNNFVEFTKKNCKDTRKHCETKQYHFINQEYAIDIMYCFEDHMNKIVWDIADIFSIEVKNKNMHSNKNTRGEKLLKQSNSNNRLDFLLNHPEAIDIIKKNYEQDFEFYGYSMNPEEMMLPPYNNNIEYRRV